MTDKLSINQKIEKLESEVEWFYSDDFELEKATGKYKESIELANEIKDELIQLKNEVEVLSEDFRKQ